MAQTLVMEGKNKFKTATYTPTCKYGFDDCVCDRAYIKTTYPEWYKEIEQGKLTCDVCKDVNKYDCEDK